MRSKHYVLLVTFAGLFTATLSVFGCGSGDGRQPASSAYSATALTRAEARAEAENALRVQDIVDGFLSRLAPTLDRDVRDRSGGDGASGGTTAAADGATTVDLAPSASGPGSGTGGVPPPGGSSGTPPAEQVQRPRPPRRPPWRRLYPRPGGSGLLGRGASHRGPRTEAPPRRTTR